MEMETVTVRNVRDIQDNGKRWLEDVLGKGLKEDQQVFIMVLSPGREPDEESRRRARVGLENTFRKTAAFAGEHGIADKEIDAAIQEAMEVVSCPWIPEKWRAGVL